MLLVQKWPFYQLFLLTQYRPGKSLLRYFRTKKHLSRLKKLKVQKVKKLTFFKKVNHAFGPKMAIFPTFVLGNIGQENVFYDILEQKSTFLGYKNEKFKKSKK